MVFNLKGEREELRERIEILRSEKKDVVKNMKVVSFMGELRCPKDFLCYNKKYEYRDGMTIPVNDLKFEFYKTKAAQSAGFSGVKNCHSWKSKFGAFAVK